MKFMISLTLLLCMSLMVMVRAGEPILEFGESVTVSEEYPDLKLADLKDKVVLIVFFQEWCPKCNVWSGGKFKAVEQAYAKDFSVVLLAMKTDGGSIQSAKNYLKNRVDLDRWVVATDKNATYYKAVTGRDALYNFAVVNGQGELIKIGYFGSNEPVAMRLADSKYMGTVQLPKDKIDEPFSKIAYEFELGGYRSAMLKLKNLEKNKDLRDGSKEFQKTINESLETKLSKLKEKLEDENNPSRFIDFMNLRNFNKSVIGFKVQNDVNALYIQMKSDTAIKKELAAETAYYTYLKNTQVIKKSELPRYKKSVAAKFSELYKDTYYASIIEKETKEIN